MKLEEASIFDLIKELSKRKTIPGTGILESDANKEVCKILQTNQNHPIGLILTLGYPHEINDKTHKCSRCHLLKSYTQFGYYQSRVDSDGYLMRVNAMCLDCRKTSNAKRKKILNEAGKLGLIPPMPKSGEICSRCGRNWDGRWHRDHDDISETFIGWKCGQCNMSAADQRDVNIKTK
jgi:hypothetical protein